MSESVHPIADLTDSLLGWASQTELELAQRLQSETLVINVDLRDDELERIERLYGIFLTRQLVAGADLNALLGVSPALTVTTLVGWARRVVNTDNFIAEYFGGLGLSPESQEVVGGVDVAQVLFQVVPAAFSSLGVYAVPVGDFTELVKLLCVHAGIVNNEVPELLELFDAHEVTTAKEVAEIIVGSAAPRLFAHALEIAPAEATRILTGITALRDFAIEHTNSWFDRSYACCEPQLPSPIAAAVRAELRERPVGTLDREGAVGVANRELRPRILLDVSRKKVCLRLPEQRVPMLEDGSFGEVNWRVSIDGTTKVYRTGCAWGEVSGLSQQLDVTISHPVREITVQDVTNGITWNVPVVDNDDPAVIFTSRGTNVTDKVSLHRHNLLVLAPADVTLMDVVSDHEIYESDSFTVEGWEGWLCHDLDVNTVASIATVAPGANPSMDRVRSVDPRQRVIFRSPDHAIDYLTSSGGLPIYAESLVADFPPTPSGQTETWYLTISSFGGVGSAGEEVAPPEPLEVPAEGGAFAVFDPELYDAPWVGEYLVRLRGPRNESFRHEYAIVEGAHANINVIGACRSFRIPSGGGLSETVLTLRPGDKEFIVEPSDVVVRALEPAANVVVSTEEGDQLPLRFSPPSLAFEFPLLTEPPMWRASRLTLRPRDIDIRGTLRIRGRGELGDPKIIVRNHHGAPVKTARLRSNDSGLTYVTPMATIVSSTSMLSSGRVDFEWTDPVSDRRVSVALADIHSSDAEELSLVDETIVVSGGGDRPLGVWVWPATAPWAPARALPVTEGSVKLPSSLVNAGNLIAQVHTVDRFMTLIAPVSPGENAVVLEQPGHFEGSDPALGALSAFLAGETEEVPVAESIMPVLWDMVTTGVASGESAKSVRKVFSSNPSAALTGLSESLVPAGKQPGRVVESGLVRARFEAGVGTHHRAPWIGVLELLGSLDAMTGADGKPLELPTQDSNETSATDEDLAAAVLVGEAQPKTHTGRKKISDGIAAKREILANIKDIAGDNVVSILKTGRDTTLDTACIDKSTVAIASMAKAQQAALLEMFFSRSQIVPGSLMDDGTRLLAVFETFNKRTELRELLSNEGLIKSAVTLLRTLRSTNKTLYSMARIRFDKLDGVDTDAHENLWALTPVVSLVLALAARMHAHGLVSSNKTLDAATPGWAKLADVVPDLVTGDLIAADAIILALAKPGIA
ncbi:hypothetical protein AN902_06375 [Corynebacterium pseudotuberculosis]|uniref:hypothetical protein n=1 Tax=Corynebacterium pseudotuberculosis TaxID=1719 RepID=UPI0006BB969C|nr:hypothetical protein [Corynebacterium pseudotuberculosis]ALF57739.1 hypothetical protein AN902_06375 [Corynebacterium pseudotuberculosis]